MKKNFSILLLLLSYTLSLSCMNPPSMGEPARKKQCTSISIRDFFGEPKKSSLQSSTSSQDSRTPIQKLITTFQHPKADSDNNQALLEQFKGLDNTTAATILNQLLTTYISKPKALFSPGDTIRNKLIELINQEKLSIHVAMYSFTDDDILNALSRAEARGVAVHVVINKPDPAKITEQKILTRNFKNLSIYQTSDKYNCMHNKMYVFSDDTVVTGSYNSTTQATNNEENIVIIKDSDVAQQYLNCFTSLIKKCEQQAHRAKRLAESNAESTKDMPVALVKFTQQQAYMHRKQNYQPQK